MFRKIKKVHLNVKYENILIYTYKDKNTKLEINGYRLYDFLNELNQYR